MNRMNRVLGWLVVSGLCLAIGQALAGGTDHPSAGTTGPRAMSCGGGAARNPAGCDGHGVLKYALSYSGDLRLSDEPTSYVPAYGPWVSLGVSMNASETKWADGLQSGGWNIGMLGYATTVVSTATTQYEETMPAPVANAVQIYLPQGGFETYISPGTCAGTSVCEFPKDPISQTQVKRAGGNAAVLSAYPAAVRAEIRDARAFTRALPGGGYEIYGGTPDSIRTVTGGYEGWLSALVDREGLVLHFTYQTSPHGLKRLASLTDATGLQTHFYYADNEPRFSDAARVGIIGMTGEDGLTSVNHSVEWLLTSIEDPYHHVAQFTYQDAWSGWVLGEPLAKMDPTFIAAMREQSRVFRLIRSQDVLGVTSQVRYDCGARTLPQRVEDLHAGFRSGERPIDEACVHRVSGVPIAPGPDWLRVFETETPYGTTRYKRIDVRSDPQHRLGWIVMNPAGNIEWKETVFGMQTPALQNELRAQLDRGTDATRPAHIPPAAWNKVLRTPSVAFRTGYGWSFASLYSWYENPVYSSTVDLFAHDTPAPAMPPLRLASITQYAHDYPAGSDRATMSTVKVWEKAPGQSEGVYYGYEDANSADTFRDPPMGTLPLTGATRAHASPSVMARRLDDGTMQATYTRYNDQGNPTITVDPLGRAQEIEYAPNGIDPINVYVVRWSVDSSGVGTATRLTRLSHADYNGLGQTIRQEGTLPGVGTTIDYETTAPYRVTGITNELGLRTRYEWTRIGTDPLTRTDQLTVTLPNGLTSTSTFQRGYLIREEGEGRVREYAGHDAFGRAATVSVGGAIKVRYTYNPNNLLDLQTIHNEVDGSEVKLSTDYLGRPEWSWQINGMGEILSVGYRRYDPSGNLASLWTSNGTYSEIVGWQYDQLGRAIYRGDMDGSGQELRYSEATGRLTASKDANEQWTYYQYDAAGALISQRLNDPMTGRELVRMDYDPIYGRLMHKTDELGITEYHYNDAQPTRLEWMEEPLGSTGRTRITPSYDTDSRSPNRRTGWSLTDSMSSTAQSHVTTTFDDSAVGMGRIRSYENEIFTATPNYDPVGALSYGELHHINYEMPGTRVVGMLQTIGHADTAHDRMMNERSYQTATGEQVISHVNYDGQGRVADVNGLIERATRTYGYDARGQLTQVTRTGAMGERESTHYSYDPMGNRTNDRNEMGTPIVTNGTAIYGLSGRLNTYQDGSTIRTAEHDRAGNLTFNPANQQRYTWNEQNRLIRIDYPRKDAKPTAKSIDYTLFTYDSEQRIKRVQEIENAVTTEDWTYVWVGGQLAQKRRTDTLQIQETYNADGYVHYNADGSTAKFFLLRDYLGSVIGKADGQGHVLERIDYDAWGQPERRQIRNESGTLTSADPNASDLMFGYAGYWEHHRSKLAITAHRFYDPKLGRWLSKDPIAELGGLNLYAYVGNSPVNATDPSGWVPRDPERCAQEIQTLRGLIGMMNTLEVEMKAIEVRNGVSGTGLTHLLAFDRFFRNMRTSSTPDALRYAFLQRSLDDLKGGYGPNDPPGLIQASEDRVRNYCGDDDDNGPDSAQRAVGEWAEGRLGVDPSGMANRNADDRFLDARDGWIYGLGDDPEMSGPGAPVAVELGLMAFPLGIEMAVGEFFGGLFEGFEIFAFP